MIRRSTGKETRVRHSTGTDWDEWERMQRNRHHLSYGIRGITFHRKEDKSKRKVNRRDTV